MYLCIYIYIHDVQQSTHATYATYATHATHLHQPTQLTIYIYIYRGVIWRRPQRQGDLPGDEHLLAGSLRYVRILQKSPSMYVKEP